MASKNNGKIGLAGLAVVAGLAPIGLALLGVTVVGFCVVKIISSKRE